MIRTSALLPALAVALIAANAQAFDCVPGRYLGKSWSTSESLHAKDVSLMVVRQPEAKGAAPAAAEKQRCEMKFSIPSSGVKEVWELSGAKLVQREFDSQGKEKVSYGATLEVRKGVEGFYLDCKGEAGCDAGGHPRNYWRIENKGRDIVYTYWGADPAKAGSEARKRLEYRFTPSP